MAQVGSSSCVTSWAKWTKIAAGAIAVGCGKAALTSDDENIQKLAMGIGATGLACVATSLINKKLGIVACGLYTTAGVVALVALKISQR